MDLETAVVPRDTRLAHLERSLAEKTDIMHELRQQRSMYLSQISDANQRIAELETRMASLQSTIQEKDSLIQMLQQSFLDPDDYSSTCGSYSQDNQLLTSLHHSRDEGKMTLPPMINSHYRSHPLPCRRFIINRDSPMVLMLMLTLPEEI